MDEFDRFNRWLEQATMDAHDTTNRLFTEAQAMLNNWAEDNKNGRSGTRELTSGASAARPDWFHRVPDRH